MEKKKILFVCLGNICRSPAAEEILRAKATKEGMEKLVHVDSAGTYGGHAGEKSDPRMRSVAGEKGYRINHRSRKITTDDFERFDLIVTMDDNNYQNVWRIAPDPESAGKIQRMADFFTTARWDHVPDPYYEGAEGFKLVIELLEEGCGELLRRIRNQEI